MYDMDQLADLLGLSRNQVRVRLQEYRSLLDAHVVHGQKNKLLIDHNGLAILQRALELEKNGLTLDSIRATLQQELNIRGDGRESSTATREDPSFKLMQAYEKLLASKDQEIAFLKDQIKEKDQQIKYFQELLNNRLPPSQDEIRQKLAQKVSRWERFKQLLKGA